MAIDVDENDVESDFDDKIDPFPVVYWSRLLTVRRYLTNKTKSLWQERANTLNALLVLRLLFRIPWYLWETVFLFDAIYNDWIAV